MPDADDERTSPDLGRDDDRTNPGVGTGDGTGEAFIACLRSARRAVDALEKLCESCPPAGSTGRDRHLQVIELGAGDTGMLFFDFRRVTAELRRKETDK